jgi:hypothetical protein
MSVLAIRSLLPDFLPEHPSVFTQDLCERAWNESAQAPFGAQAEAIPLQQQTLEANVEANVEALVRLYASLFRLIQEQQKIANTCAERLTRWNVWDEYSRKDLPILPEQAMLPLRGIVTAFPMIERTLRQGKIPDNIVFRSAWRFFCLRHGHRAWYEGDIAVPRFDEDLQTTFAHILHLAPVRKYDDEFPTAPTLSIKARLFHVIWRKYIAAQHEIETHRSETMRQAYALRQAMLASGATLVRQGRLKTLNGLWNLPVQEVILL